MRRRNSWIWSGFVASLFCASLCMAQDLETMRASVVKITAKIDETTRVGSGFVVKLENDLAYILTAQHVIAGDKNPELLFFAKRGKSLKAKVVKADALLDIAVLALDRKNLPKDTVAIQWAPTGTVSLGDQVHTIGFSGGAGDWAVIPLNVASSEGALYRLSGSVDEGNSGGPLIKQLRVVGLVKEVKGHYVHAVRGDFVVAALPSLGVMLDKDVTATAPSQGTGRGNPSDLERALAKANIVLAEGDMSQVREWLKSDPAYRALAESCLKLLQNKRVLHPIPLDVINGYYMESMSAGDYLPPEKYKDWEKLKLAIFNTWRQRHTDATRTKFDLIVERAAVEP